MARKFLQRGWTRARRYANHQGGRKYDKTTGEELPRTEDKEKASAVFYEHYVVAQQHKEFANVKYAQAMVASWRSDYNLRRPHGSLGYRIPAAFAAGCLASASATPALQPDSRSNEEQALSSPQTVLS